MLKTGILIETVEYVVDFIVILIAGQTINLDSDWINYVTKKKDSSQVCFTDVNKQKSSCRKSYRNISKYIRARARTHTHKHTHNISTLIHTSFISCFRFSAIIFQEMIFITHEHPEHNLVSWGHNVTFFTSTAFLGHKSRCGWRKKPYSKVVSLNPYFKESQNKEIEFPGRNNSIPFFQYPDDMIFLQKLTFRKLEVTKPLANARPTK